MRLDPANIDRRIIFLLVILALTIPILSHWSVKPARMKSAEAFFEAVERADIKPGEIAFVSLDYGPNSMAENLPQSEVAVEHLMRKGIPIAFYTQYVQAEPFLNSVPEQVSARLMRENPGRQYEYGKDWVNLGYRPGGALMLQNLARSDNLVELFKNDARGNNLATLPAFAQVNKLEKIKFLVQFTSLTGTLDTFLQFFQNKNYRPLFLHGCTSITIPQAYIYLDSGQLGGLLEGIAGAAWYASLLSERWPAREPGSTYVMNTALGVAHLVIIVLVVLGNLAVFLKPGRGANG
jgi:hypothetical protein